MNIKTPVWLSSQEVPRVLGALCQGWGQRPNVLMINHNITDGKLNIPISPRTKRRDSCNKILETAEQILSKSEKVNYKTAVGDAEK